MKEMMMLDVEKIDLRSLGDALEDNSPGSTWLFDPRTGQTEIFLDDDPDRDEADDPVERGFIAIEPISSHEAYQDLEEFTSRVRDAKARDLLERAIAGRGAFRRFKDTLFEFPELREAWFRFHDVRMERRAIDWLRDQTLIDVDAARKALGERPDPDPSESSGAFDAHAIARAVAADLKELYAQRLRKVLLFGSWARGDAHAESDIDLLVVLDTVDDISRWNELDRMDDVLWRHSEANDTVVTAFPVSESDFEHRPLPFLINARKDGIQVA